MLEKIQRQSKMKFFLLLSAIGFCWAQYAPNTKPGKTSIVHLFEWRWADIALECERYLGPKGFGGVQVGIVYSINCRVFVFMVNGICICEVRTTFYFTDKYSK